MQHILIIRPGAIGDTLLTLPVIEALKAQHFPAHITLVGNAAVLPLARAPGIADEVFDYEAPQWSELFSTSGIRTPELQALLQRTSSVIGWLRDSDGVIAHNLQQTGISQMIITPGRPPAGKRVHEITYLAQTIGVQVDIASVRYTIPSPGQQRPPILTSLSETTIAIHPGSGGANKCWPVEYFATLIHDLWQRNIPVLLLGGPADEERIVALHIALNAPASSTLLTTMTNTPLLEVARQLQCCKGYLGNDSGLTHLAALLGLPTIALFGPSDPTIWHPPGSTVKVLYEPVLANLSPDVVVREILAFFL